MRQPMGGAPVIFALAGCVLIGYCALGQPDDQQSDEIILEQEQIFVNLEEGTTFSMMIDPNDSVLRLFDDLHEQEAVAVFRTKLQLGDTQLNMTAKLSDYNIRAGSMVSMVIPEDRGHYTTSFNVRTRDGRVLPIETLLGNSVSSLKDNITQLTGVQQAQQRLLFLDKELKNERTLRSYDIYNDTTIDLVGPLEECRRVVTIFVKTLSGATIELEANLADTVADLKEMIWRKAGVPTGVQHLAANQRKINGEKHLCDLGLEAGSTVFMWLFSSRITSLDQVARLKPLVALPVNNYKAPIFREAEDVADSLRGRPVSIYKDARNWVAQTGIASPAWESSLFDPVAHLSPDPDNEQRTKRFLRTLEDDSRPDASEEKRIEVAINRARFELSAAVKPYRVKASRTSVNQLIEKNPGITLGGGSAVTSSEQPVPLGTDVNNWAPDAFSDSDVMRLFEVVERVRQVLARAAQTGEGLLGIESQRRINNAILFTYLEALAGYLPPIKYYQPKEDEQCSICMEDLIAESGVKLICEHTFHANCIQTWVTDLYLRRHFPTCPFCRQRFMFPYEALGKAQLETLELRDNSGGESGS